MTMLLWLDSDLKAKIHQVNVEKMTDYKPFNFKIVGNNNLFVPMYYI